MKDLIPFLIFAVIFIVSILGFDNIVSLLSEFGGVIAMVGFLPILVVLLIVFVATSVKIVNEYERAVIFRLGRVLGKAKGPGLFILIPFIDKMVKVDLRVVTMDVPTQDVITKDNVSVQVDAVVYFKVIDPIKAVVNVENYLYATSQISQTTLRSVCGQAEFDELLSQRDKINAKLQEIIDQETDQWGVKVVAVELKRIDITEELKRAIARQAEAERERRAKVIQAEAEYQAAQKLTEAAELLAKHPLAIQLRYLETISTVGQYSSNTILLPLPVELLDIIKSYKTDKKEC
ncbi:SpfH domain protein [Sulfurihydrogenibium azorense Az-Fu1]|uniref:Protein QmcA n=1 Tax=Sulfurihydrogenibium azorense (strain DSM 15241 / OCM 825 / Az-Fu1) TaxID=204536 RepID=C1DWR1_SULAA|nr:slipin family protein [Sulfurihydrogenibium azorense]ACN98335.1 SpfH domain protein [Sulfurihydrogenibium azorense Az-Fu1]